MQGKYITINIIWTGVCIATCFSELGIVLCLPALLVSMLIGLEA